MYFELQLSGMVFARAVRNRLRAIPLGVDLSFPRPNGDDLVVDRIVIGDTTSIQQEQTVSYATGAPVSSPAATQSVWAFSPLNLTNFTVPYVQVRQEVNVLLVSASDLISDGVAPSPPTETLTIFPVFNIALTAANATQGGGPMTLSYSLAYIDFGLAGLLLNDAQRTQITQIVSGVGISPSTVDLSALSGLLDRRVTAINAGIACDPKGSRVALRVDFDVSDRSLSITKAFFESGPDDLLSGKDWAMLIDATALLRDAESKTKDALIKKGGMKILSDPSATWDPSRTTMNVSAGIRLLGACPNFVDDTDLDVRINVGAHFNVPTPNNLVIHYQLDKELTDNSQVFACALTGGLLYPFAGVALFASGKLALTTYFGTIVFAPFLSFGEIVGIINAQQLEDDISSSLGKTCHKINDSEYECTNDVDLGIQLVPNVNSRLVLDGAHGVPAGLVMSGPITGLGELFLGSITDVALNPFGWKVLGGCNGNRSDNFHIGNQAKITVDYVPPARLMSARIFSDPENGYTVSINDNEITVTPRDPPVSYDCKVRVITNRGVRTITIPAAHAITGAEQTDLNVALLRASASCFYWSKIFTPQEKIQWLVDPPQLIIEGEQQWQILVKAIDPRSTLKVLTAAGDTVFTGRPSRGGNIYASLMFAVLGAPSELHLELHRPSLGVSPEGVELSVQQTLYNLQARLPVEGKMKRMEFIGGFRQPQLRILTTRQISHWDLKNALAPQLLSTIAVEPRSEVEEEWVSHNGCGVDYGLLSEVAEAVESLFGLFGKPHAIGSPSVPGFGKTLYFRTGDKTTVYDISSPGAPEEIHSLSGAAWYEGTASTLNLLARHDPAHYSVNLYQVVGRHTV